MSERVRFQLPAVTSEPEGVEDDLALAVFVAECVHGRPQTRLEVRYLVAADRRSCTMEVSGPAGETALRVLIGLLSARFGEEAFKVARVDRNYTFAKRVLVLP